jgi:hypothetical protein
VKYDFVEIGTCDFDTLLQSCKDHERGISIEAIKQYLDNLPDRGNVTKLNAVVSQQSGEDFIYTLSEKTIREFSLPDWIRGCSKLGSPHPYVLDELRKKNIEHLYEKNPVRTITITEIIEEYSITEIGILKTDLEGNDLSIINSLLDYGKVLPREITFEYNREHSLESTESKFEQLVIRLENFGYRKTKQLPGGNFSFELMTRIAVVSMYDDNYTDMAAITIKENFRTYCSVHGYELVDFKIEGDFLEGRHAQWGKIKLLKELIEKNIADWFFFIDCDCLIMNPTIKLESFLEEDKFVIFPRGGGSPDNPLSNSSFDDNIMSSQILIKNCQRSLEFLDEIWNSPDWPEGMDINEFDHEMRQIRISSQKDAWRDGILLLEERLLNRFWAAKNPFMVDAFPHMNKNLWEPGDFIVHVTSYSKNERIEILSLLSQFSGGKLGKWERKGNQVFYKPLSEAIGKIRIALYKKGIEKIHWNLETPSRKLVYWISTDNFESGDIIRVYDQSNSEIALHLIK